MVKLVSTVASTTPPVNPMHMHVYPKLVQTNVYIDFVGAKADIFEIRNINI